MLNIFDNKYLAISNIFVKTYLGQDFIYPSPFYISGTLYNDKTNTKDELILIQDSYDHSILSLDGYFSIFIFALSLEYKIHSIYIDLCSVKETNNEAYGTKGVISFISDNVSINIGQSEVWQTAQKIQKKNQSMMMYKSS